VREVLEEYARAAGDGLILDVIDPVPFSEAEDEAVQAGLTGVPVGEGQTFYFGMVATNAVEGREVIPFFDAREERFLEYEISRTLHVLANPAKSVVGVLSSLPLDGAPPSPLAPAQQPWQIMREIRALFEVRMLSPGIGTIDEDVTLLVVIHPQTLPENTQYAIDQFVLRGGSAILFLDPNCEAQPPPPGSQQNPMMMFEMNRASSLPRLLQAWGVTMDEAGVAADRKAAIPVQVGGGGGAPVERVSFIGYLSLGEESIARQDPVTGLLSRMTVGTSGFLTDAGGGVGWTPLLATTRECMRVEASKFKFMPDPKQLLAEFVSRDEPMVLAARVSRPAQSAFPSGPPGEAAEPPAAHRASGNVNVVLVADVDMLADRFWVEEVRLGNIRLGHRKFADNGDFVINTLDNMAGSGDLISIRARGEFTRPFTLVEDIRKQAEQRYRSEEQALQEKLRETERKLNDLQRARTDDTQEGTFILSPEQEQELRRFNQERADTRRQLRTVRLNLDRDIQRLGWWLRAINIFAVPAAVAVAAVVLGLYRTSRHRRDRRAAGAR
jgi:ABC-type uncharacterized transport system involved in gliding motility auxiliary subunit